MIGPQYPEESPAPVANSTLRSFAALSVAIFGVLSAWSAYRHAGAPTVAAWLGLAFAVVVGLPGLIHPEAIRPVYLVLMAITKPVGHVVSYVLMAVIYYGLLTPLALGFRLAGRDALRSCQPAAASDWLPKSQPTDVRRYLRQYQRQQGGSRSSSGT